MNLQHNDRQTLNPSIGILLEYYSFVLQLSQTERRFCLRQSDSLFHSVEGKSQLAIWETQFCSRLRGTSGVQSLLGGRRVLTFSASGVQTLIKDSGVQSLPDDSLFDNSGLQSLFGASDMITSVE